jgi:hypothetical protein
LSELVESIDSGRDQASVVGDCLFVLGHYRALIEATAAMPGADAESGAGSSTRWASIPAGGVPYSRTFQCIAVPQVAINSVCIWAMAERVIGLMTLVLQRERAAQRDPHASQALQNNATLRIGNALERLVHSAALLQGSSNTIALPIVPEALRRVAVALTRCCSVCPTSLRVHSLHARDIRRYDALHVRIFPRGTRTSARGLTFQFTPLL